MLMKILAYVLFAFSALLASCHRAPIVVNADEIAATKQLNEKYHDLIVGHWHHFSQTELTEVTQEFVFKTDGTYTGHILYRSRKQVMVGGKPVLTDWTKQIDEDLEKYVKKINLQSKGKKIKIIYKKGGGKND